MLLSEQIKQKYPNDYELIIAAEMQEQHQLMVYDWLNARGLGGKVESQYMELWKKYREPALDIVLNKALEEVDKWLNEGAKEVLIKLGKEAK